MWYIRTLSTFLGSTEYWECYTGNGADYMGKVDHANDGKQCQQWSFDNHVDFFAYGDDDVLNTAFYETFENVFHEYKYDNDDSTTEAHNYCR